MSTNKKILLIVAGFLMIILIVFILIFRSSMNKIHAKAAIKERYKAVPVGSFEKLDFSSRCIVRIRQGKECFVELKAKDDVILKPKLENINGTLYVKIDSTCAKTCSDSLHVRIAMPSLFAINSAGGSKIHLESFDTDSLIVVLGNGCVYTGNSNTLKKVTYKTSGEVMMQFKNPF
jgi:hypothetical protein